MKRRDIKIALLTTLALILVPATAGADDSHRHHGRDEHHDYHAYGEHHEHHELHGERLGTFKAKLAESNCNSLEGRARGTCYAYCEVLNCSSEANSGKKLCLGLANYYQRITQTSVAPPCTGEIQTTSTESSASCPCFSDLSQEGFTASASCNGTGGISQISEFNGSTYLLAEGGVSGTFTECRLGDASQISIPNEEAAACANIIDEFCQAMP